MAIYLRLFLLLLILFESVKLFKIIFIDGKIHPVVAHCATAAFSIFVIFILLESIFMFIPRSHSVDLTLASKLWYAKYWKPINSLGFRDKEPDNNHPVILFVGDSFTTGHGLKSVEERFSNLVAGKLNEKSEKYTVINIGRNNLDSREEYDSMINFFHLTRIKPEIIVLQYYGNDINGAALDSGIKYDGFRPPPGMNKILILIGSGSYFLNYLYWISPRDYLGKPYINFLTQAYKNDTVLSSHKDDLKLFIDYAGTNSIKLIAVVFPLLNDLEFSDALYVNNIVNFFKTNHINTINVSSLAKAIPLSERTINTNDGHASPELNKIVAEEILRHLSQQDRHEIVSTENKP